MDKKVITLLKTQAYIDGAWVGKPTLPVTDKATGEVIAHVPALGAAETKQAIAAAHEAFKTWSKLLAKERSQVLRRWYDLIIEHGDELALLLTTEQGKPIAEAKGEILYGASFVVPVLRRGRSSSLFAERWQVVPAGPGLRLDRRGRWPIRGLGDGEPFNLTRLPGGLVAASPDQLAFLRWAD